MKKKLVVLFLLSVVVFSAWAGGQTEAETSQEKETIVLEFAALMAPDHPHVITHQYFADKVAEYSDGAVTVEVFPGGQLGHTQEVIVGMQLGDITMGKVATAFLTQTVPEVKVFDLPYLFKDRDHLFRVLNGEVGQKFNNEIFPKYGLKGLYYLDDGSRSIYADTAVRSPEDMAGMKIRVMTSDIMIETINKMGGIGTPMAWPEVYTGLEQNIIDGAENSPVLFDVSKHWEVKKVYSLTEQFQAVCCAFVSMNTWEGLPDYAKEAIEKAAADAADFGRKKYVETEESAIEKLKSHGVQVIEDVDISAFRDRVQPVYDIYTEEQGTEILDMIRDAE